GMIFTARRPVVVQDKLYFYYGGFDRVHDDTKGVQGAIGLPIIRLDGFCSMHAEDKEGWLISRREVFHMPQVDINAVTKDGGYIEAELLDRDNRVIPGFSRSECLRFQGDSVRGTIQWKTKSFPRKWRAKDKKIRFYVTNGDLYSYLPVAIELKKDDGWPDY
ncbi:MAG: hypothetical protein P8J37_03570, partial [Fuerstiella sp.]|nr:hypothetical protein [Fuerstiella sp.]